MKYLLFLVLCFNYSFATQKKINQKIKKVRKVTSEEQDYSQQKLWKKNKKRLIRLIFTSELLTLPRSQKIEYLNILFEHLKKLDHSMSSNKSAQIEIQNMIKELFSNLIPYARATDEASDEKKKEIVRFKGEDTFFVGGKMYYCEYREYIESETQISSPTDLSGKTLKEYVTQECKDLTNNQNNNLKIECEKRVFFDKDSNPISYDKGDIQNTTEGCIDKTIESWGGGEVGTNNWYNAILTRLIFNKDGEIKESRNGFRKDFDKFSNRLISYCDSAKEGSSSQKECEALNSKVSEMRTQFDDFAVCVKGLEDEDRDVNHQNFMKLLNKLDSKIESKKGSKKLLETRQIYDSEEQIETNLSSSITEFQEGIWQSTMQTYMNPPPYLHPASRVARTMVAAMIQRMLSSKDDYKNERLEEWNKAQVIITKSLEFCKPLGLTKRECNEDTFTNTAKFEAFKKDVEENKSKLDQLKTSSDWIDFKAKLHHEKDSRKLSFAERMDLINNLRHHCTDVLEKIVVDRKSPSTLDLFEDSDSEADQ